MRTGLNLRILLNALASYAWAVEAKFVNPKGKRGALGRGDEEGITLAPRFAGTGRLPASRGVGLGLASWITEVTVLTEVPWRMLEVILRPPGSLV